MANYRNPGPRREEPRVGSGPDVAFPLDPLDPVQSSVRLIFIVKNNVFGQFFGNRGPILALTVKRQRKISVSGLEP